MHKDIILRVIAIGPLPDDRRIILIEIPRLDATCLNFSQNVIEARLKKVGLRMCSPMYWIDHGTTQTKITSVWKWRDYLKYSNGNLYCECDKFVEDKPWPTLDFGKYI